MKAQGSNWETTSGAVAALWPDSRTRLPWEQRSQSPDAIREEGNPICELAL
jgi:hypothetical protein